MELKRIHKSSAMPIGVIALGTYLVTGLLTLILQARVPGYSEQYGTLPIWQAIGLVPIVGALVSYIIALAVIALYNWVAKTHPIAWDLKK